MSCLSKHWGCVLDMALQMSPSHLSLKASSFWRKIQTMWRVRTNVIHNDITCTQLWLCSYYGLLLLCCTPVRNMQCMFGLEHCTLARGQATPIEGVYMYPLLLEVGWLQCMFGLEHCTLARDSANVIPFNARLHT